MFTPSSSVTPPTATFKVESSTVRGCKEPECLEVETFITSCVEREISANMMQC